MCIRVVIAPLDSSTRLDAAELARSSGLNVEPAGRRMRRFYATWLDDPVATERVVTLDEMIETIESGVIARSAFVVRVA